MKTRGKPQTFPLNEAGFGFKWQMLFYKHSSHAEHLQYFPYVSPPSKLEI